MSAKRTLLITLTLMVSLTLMSSCGHSKSDKIQPLAYSELRLGSIKPEGWLRETLLRQRNGMTSQMDSLYPEVMGPRNGWLGGDGDQWERGHTGLTDSFLWPGFLTMMSSNRRLNHG